ncbi:MAG: thiamine phosphate synthase [Sphingomonadales bacterium]|nr:thiamine phosphate synthase [Sphingomonadales bacterium]
MVRRHPLPEIWLLSDERLGASIAEHAAILPPGSGIVLRHDRMAAGARWRLMRRLARIARSRKLTLLLAGSPAQAKRWAADGVHLRQHAAGEAARARRLGLIVTMPVHDAREARRAKRAGVNGAFVSPLHPTRSHPGAPALGHAAWERIARMVGAKAIALGGLTPLKARRLKQASTVKPGWAAIDAWQEKAANRRKRQKRNAVPT